MAPFNSSPSSSSSKPTGRWTYDVFLSFSGEDTRDNFVEHLYAALVLKRIHAFKDNEMLRKGRVISTELMKAIEESRFAVVVFSKSYSNSSWCLDELAKIMECKDQMGHKVLPVFYHVTPSDVRGQKQNFQEYQDEFRGKTDKENNHTPPLKKLRNCYCCCCTDKENKWRKALAAAAGISGWHIGDIKRDESTVINQIVHVIFADTQHRDMDNNLVGIESRIDALNSLLSRESTNDVLIVGICGMGGVGKTTIALALFRRIASQFEGSSFVKDVRENSSSKKDICVLQEQMLRDVLVTQSVSVIQDPNYGANIIQKKLCNNKILLVLDDVDNGKQLEFLAATHEWFGPGSRIIITTRNEHLLSDANAIYKPAMLLEEQAIYLFSRYAFRENSPPDGYEKLSYRAISYTGCLPLALKVLGSFFHGRKVDVWESALNRLAKKPNIEIYETLKLSFDGLEDSEKEILLDIACFFKGKTERYATEVLDSFGFDSEIGISVLNEKSLITISNGRLQMHDLIQEMGKQIVRENFPDSRVWQLEKIHDFIMRPEKLKAIEAIVEPWEVQKPGFTADVFKSMENLRLLDVNCNFTSSEPTFLPGELRWLRWNDYPFSSIPLANMRRLVGLELSYGRIEHLWNGQMILPNLKLIQLERLNWLTKFPDISEIPNVERLILSYCENLLEVDESLSFHKKLVYLDMSGCQWLKSLSSTIEMESLETLNLTNCHRLERLPEISPCMVKLSNIYLESCYLIEVLPSSIRYLSSLRVLNLTNCKSLWNIPDSICELQQLKKLHLHNCLLLQNLPEDLGIMQMLEEIDLGLINYNGKLELPEMSIDIHSFIKLCSLRKLDLRWRLIKDDDFPTNLHALSSLEELYLSGNSKFTHLPTSISHLSRLKHLEVSECCQLQSLLGLPSRIQVLIASDCISLEKIDDLSGKYEWLYKIWLVGCVKLLEDEESKSYLDKMLQKSLIKNCAAVDHRLSITIPGNKLPSWFKEQNGNQIAVKLPQDYQAQITGFVLCGLFQGQMMYMGRCSPEVIFTIEHDGNKILELEGDCVDESEVGDNGNVWISYMPLNWFQQMFRDFHLDDLSCIKGNIIMSLTLTGGYQAVRCGAHIMYKDAESIQQVKDFVSDYRKLEYVHGHGNSRACIEMCMSPSFL